MKDIKQIIKEGNNLREQFNPINFAESFQWFKLQATNDCDYEKDYELRMAVREYINQRGK